MCVCVCLVMCVFVRVCVRVRVYVCVRARLRVKHAGPQRLGPTTVQATGRQVGDKWGEGIAGKVRETECV